MASNTTLSQRISTDTFDTIELQKLGNTHSPADALPADYHDPNHPHFPGVLEAQNGSNDRKCTKKKITFVTGGTVLFIATLIAALFVGMKIAHHFAPVSAPIPVVNVTSVEWHTTTMTMTDVSTSVGRFITIPAPITLTTFVTPTPTTTVPFEAPVRPTSDNPPSPSADNGSKPEQSPPAEGKNGCTEVRMYGTIGTCETHCQAKEGKVTHCEAFKSNAMCFSCDA